MSEIPLTIIGGGVVGNAIAHELSKDSELELALIEKNPSITSENQSSRNSGVIHAGIYYNKKTMPLKAEMCVKGNKMLYEFSEEHNIPHKQTGKLVVATNNIEEEYLLDVQRMAIENNVPNTRIISGKEVQQIEPNITATKALYVPTSGIIESTLLVSKLGQLAERAGAYYLTGTEVSEIQSLKKGFRITTKSQGNEESFETDCIINAAGLYSDEIARIVNKDSPYKMDPIRGESAKFYNTKPELYTSGMNIYPAPYGILPNGDKLEANFEEFTRLLNQKKISKTVGVHLTPTFDFENEKYVIGNTVTIGPASVGGIGKEDYTQTRDENYYFNRINGFFKNIKPEDISMHQAGIRAKLKDYNDFVIERDPQYPDLINVIGIDSPGLTSSLTIAKRVKEIYKN